jgi:DMSO/TMAO reductase YedYZ molybdopterin-dependent catalytic subunit
VNTKNEKIMNEEIDQEKLEKRNFECLQRRGFLRSACMLGALSTLQACELTTSDAPSRILRGLARFNDDLQAWLFKSSRLAPEYPDSMMTHPFPFNAYYDRSKVPIVDSLSYRLEVLGRVRNRKPWTLAELSSLPQVSQTTRHIAAEGWSAIGKWKGIRLSDFLLRIGADTKGKYIGFKCADDYYTSIDMASALHPQTILALSFMDKPLPPEHGFPMRLKIPTKLGYKNPKHITAIYVTNVFPGGYWEDRGYNWFAGC